MAPFSTTAEWFNFSYMWLLTIPCGLLMSAALLSIITGMISELWHDGPHYLHEHDAEWIKKNV